VTPLEKRGDEARALGDTNAAITEYTKALDESPIMDFEWERIRDKRKALVGNEWGPRLDAVSGLGNGKDALERCQRLLEFRRDSRANRTTLEIAKQTDEVIARECTAEALSTSVADDPGKALEQVLTLLEQAERTYAPQGVFDALSKTIDGVLIKPLRAAGTPTADLAAVLTLRERLRARKLAAAIDARLNPQLEAITKRSITAPTPAEAPARFLELVSLRTRAQQLGAPAATLTALDGAVADASTQALVLIDEKAKARRYLEAVELLSSLTTKSEKTHPFRKRLEALLAEAAAFHTEQAVPLPDGYRRLLQTALASSFATANRKAYELQRTALAPTWETNLQLVPSGTSSGCDAASNVALRGLTTTGRTKQPLSVSVGRCPATEREESLNRSEKYEAIEVYFVKEQVQTGTRSVQVQVGFTTVQCSKPSSLPGMVWQGTCQVPNYETRYEPVYELVDVKKERTVTKEVPYVVRKRTVSAEVSGVVSFTWEDGTRFDLPLTAEVTGSGEAYAYVVPGKRETDPGTRRAQSFSSDLTPARFLERASSNAATRVRNELHEKLRAHRAQRARDEGARALTANDEVTAAEAFIRSVLLDGKAEGAAAKWLEAQLGVKAPRVNTLLSSSGLALVVPAESVEAVAAAPYDEKGPVAREDSYAQSAKGLEKDLSTPTTENYRQGIRSPNEVFGFHGGLAPWDLQTGPLIGQRVAASVGLEMQLHPLEMIGLRYGLVVHDALSVRFSIGIMTAPKTEYVDGKKEDGLAVTIDASYALYLGLRAHYFAIFAGAQAGYQHAAMGESWAYGYHLEPAARLTLRLFRTEQITLEATGFLPFVPGVARKDRITLIVPIPLGNGATVKLQVERSRLQGSWLGSDGTTRESLGDVGFNTASLLIGFRF
jgi:hypothetical protein